MTKLIAEIGINHLGEQNKLFNMIQTLSLKKIDSCKLQFRNDTDFFDANLEMGSTLISQELDNVNLSLQTTVEAVAYAKNLGIEVGVSFFRREDAELFIAEIKPDYCKVPSAEALNFELIKFLQSTGLPVYVSTGGLSFEQLRLLAGNIDFRSFDCVMYCVANYPAALGASVPSYIQAYRELFNCLVGYSSHDADWEINIAYLAHNVDIIERHFTADKSDLGLDITTSSDIDELVKLQKFCSASIWSKSYSIRDKTANQGELQNLKDLGSGYYFKNDHDAGEIVSLSSLDIRSPCRGIRAGSINTELKLTRKAFSGEPLSSSHFEEIQLITEHLINRCNEYQLSLPVRLHDFTKIDEQFCLTNYEWHLSYAEVPISKQLITQNFRKNLKDKKFSIHLPDYVSSKYLIDPFSTNSFVRNNSKKLIEDVIDLAKNLQNITGEEVPIVGSFSVVGENKVDFYHQLSEMIGELYADHSVKIFPQFLPKVAWYFGGAVELKVFCSIADLNFYTDLPFGICLDTAHCIMAANFYHENPKDWMNELVKIAGHIHISDAVGIDGEGVEFGTGDLQFMTDHILLQSTRKVIEQWEGHLNDFKGFKEAIQYLTR